VGFIFQNSLNAGNSMRTAPTKIVHFICLHSWARLHSIWHL